MITRGHNRNPRGGFSLLEVTLAIFVIGSALLVMMSLFPRGMQESQYSMADTQEALFADYVLNTMQGESMAVTNWTVWENTNMAVAGVYADGQRHVTPFPFSQPDAVTNQLTYNLSVANNYGGNPMIKRVTLTVMGAKYGVYDARSRTFVTELFYGGM